jgi:hypothetical protein
MLNRLTPLVLVIFCVMSGSGCISGSRNNETQPLQSAVVTSYYARMDIPSNATYSVGGISIGGTASSDLNMQDLNQVIHETIMDVMTEKGFTLLTAGRSFLTVEYFMAMEGELSEAELNKRFLISAGIPSGSASRKYPKGTLFLDIVHSESERLIWRGTAQAFADVNASEKKREERSYAILRQLLSSFE